VEFLLQSAGVLGGCQRIDDINGGSEAHRVTLQAGGVAQCDGQMGLAQAHAAEEDYIGFILDKLQPEQVLHLEPIDLAWPSPLERLQSLDHREASLADTPLDTALLPLEGLPLNQLGQVIDMPPMVLGGCYGQGFVVFLDKRESQIGQLPGQGIRSGGLRFCGAAHFVSSVSVGP